MGCLRLRSTSTDYRWATGNCLRIATNYHASRRNKKQFIIICTQFFTGLQRKNKSRSGHNCTKLKGIFSKAVRMLRTVVIVIKLSWSLAIGRNQHLDWMLIRCGILLTPK